jgi:hypothetical protein
MNNTIFNLQESMNQNNHSKILSHEYARLITINYCPFTVLTTKNTILKIEKELDEIYNQYMDGCNKDYIDEKIQSYIDDVYEDDDEQDVKQMLINLYKILVGDDMKDQDELNHFYDKYSNIVSCFNQLFTELLNMIYGYIFLRNRKIFNVFEKPEFIINGDITTFDLDKHDDKSWGDNISFRNQKGTWIPISKLDLAEMKDGEIITLSQMNKNIYKLFVVENDNEKFFQVFKLQPVDPINIIKLCTNHEDVLRDVIHIYKNNVFNRLKTSQKKIILDFIEKEKKEILDIFENKISKDIIENIIINQIFHQITDEDKELKNKVIEIQTKYQKTCEGIEIDDNQIFHYLKYCLDTFDVLNNRNFEDKSLKRETLLKIISKIYIFLKTSKGIYFLNKYPRFNQVVEERKTKLLTDIRRGEEWFRDILM